LGKDNNPKAVISKLSNDLLEAFKETRLIDKYDIYQHLMTYWEEIMQDDTYIVTADEWSAGNELIRLQNKNSKGTKKEIAGLVGLEGRLIPVSLIIKTYLYQEKAKLDQLQTELEQIGSRIEETKGQHSGDEGFLNEVINDKGNITKGELSKRIKEIKAIDNKQLIVDNEEKQELELLEKYNQLLGKEADCKAKIKGAEKDLEKKVIAKYPTLTIEEIKKLVVDIKWITELENRIMGEVVRLSQTLASRVKELAERYDKTLPQMEKETETLTHKVEEHLNKMGFEV
jgi:type I restriction enzyme M protein